jgi:lysine decarboxylase
MFNGTQTTSPSAAILASIDGARALLHLHGPDLLGPVITAVAHARAVLARIPDLIVLDGPGVDPLKLVLLLPGTGATGYAIASELLGHGIDLETIDRDILIPQITLADTPDGIAAMVTVLSAAIRRHARRARRGLSAAAWQVEPTVVMSPRDAFYATTVTVPWSAALGRVSAELIAPYPPGIPVLAPGELITAAALELLTDAQAAGVTIAYAADPTLATVRVVA